MDLVVKKREQFGKSVKNLRSQGLVPAELYGRGIANLHLSIPVKEFKKVFKAAGENTLVNVVLDKEAPRPALIYNVQSDSLTDELLQIDLYQVRMDEKIKTMIPLDFIGEAPATKTGAILVKSMKEVEVEALPAELPRKIEVVLGSLQNIGQSIYAKDLKVSPAVKLMVSPETVVASIIEQAAEEEVAAEAPSMESVVVETEEKKAERQAKKESTGGEQTAKVGEASKAKVGPKETTK